jgi:hypothetical protein
VEMTVRSRYYRLVGHEVVPVRDAYLYNKQGMRIGLTRDADILKEWVDAWSVNRVVAQTVVGPMRVSTVFLVIDHNQSLDPDALPLVFETMIFDSDGDDRYQERYSTWNEAEAGHAKAVALAEMLLEKTDG